MNKVKKMKKIVTILFILLVMFSVASPYCYASSIGNSISGADDFIQTGTQKEPIGAGNVKKLSDNIYNVLLAIGIVITVIVGLILGIQFMTGSVQAKGKVKEALIPYVTGCVVIFGAFGIWKLVVTILQAI